ncbi:MAG: two-component regulator propeller domain-containing protein, partial [Spirochaetaceae bacterium]|nr:two-component regulator propeller domain-containing protein [Spirochaetaceae bacterium]
GTEGGGLDLLDPATGRFSHHAPQAANPRALRGASVRAVYEDYRGRLWVGTWDGGLSVMEGRSGEFRSFGPATGDPAALGDASVNCIFEDSSGTLWVGTGGSGLAMLDPISDRFIHFGEAEGLAGATVYGILEDAQGYLWISTAVGLSRFDKATSSFYNFGPEEGLASGDLSQNAFLASRGGELWFGGSGGLTRFDPSALPSPPPPPEIAIIGVESAGEERDFELGADGASVFLGYRNSGISFHIVVLDYVAPRRNRYAMKLEGRQTLWTSLGTSNSGYIAPLAPGKYSLRVKGSNGSGIWNEKGAALSITVTPPIWATWYARLAIGLAAAASVAATLFFRLRNLKRRNALLVKFSRHVEAAREEERAIAAREVHD